MTNMTNGCKWAVGAAFSIWFGLTGSAHARVFILDDQDNAVEQMVVEFKGCRAAEAETERLVPLLRQRPTNATSIATVTVPAAAPSTRIAMTPPVHATRFSLPLMIGIGY